MTIRDDVDAYFRTYDKASFAVFASGAGAPGETEVAAFEEHVGFRLPEEFRTFTMSRLGGLYMEAREDLWPRPQAYEAGPFWSFLYAIKVFGIATDAPDWLDIRVQYQSLADNGTADLVPVLQVQGDPNHYCYNRDGGLVLWRYDEPDEREPIGGTFSDLLLHEIAELEDRLRRKRELTSNATNRA